MVVSFLELFESLLQLDELVSEQFVVLSVAHIEGLSLGLLMVEKGIFVAKTCLIPLELLLQTLHLLEVHLLSLVEHVIVEAKLFLIEPIDSLHVFHAFFEDLHLGLQLDLLLGLLVRVLAHHFLQLLCVFLLLLLALVKELHFDGLVLVEKSLDLSLVAIKNVHTLSVEFGLNSLQLHVVLLSHFHELSLHVLNETVDVFAHLLDLLDVAAVLLADLLVELFDQLLFVADDLLAGGLLRFDVLSKSKVVRSDKRY